MSRARVHALPVLGLALVAATACGAPAVGPAPAGADPPTGTVTVLAAASLTEAFTQLGKDFEAAHPGTRVRLSFAGSSQLAQQINAGAPADVFAVASATTMTVVTDAVRGGGEPRVFARNQLVIAVPKGNPGGIAGPVDLVGSGRKVALCAPQVPCGAAARTALQAAGVTLTPVTLEQDVKAALAKVRLGEVDAALVYRTDTRAAAREVDAVEFPASAAAITDYPILALPTALNPSLAAAFVDYVLSDQARAVFTGAGFQTP